MNKKCYKALKTFDHQSINIITKKYKTHWSFTQRNMYVQHQITDILNEYLVLAGQLMFYPVGSRKTQEFLLE